MPSRTCIAPSPRSRSHRLQRLPQCYPSPSSRAGLAPASVYVPDRTVVTHPAGAMRRIADVSIQRPATVRLRTSLFLDAVEIVEQEYATDVSLDDIARRVASSRRQLQRAYAEVGGTTFREHLTRLRMQRAAELLARRNLTVREVARRVGYRQPAQFAKAFRRYQGQAPSAFRSTGARMVDSDLPRAA